jgi:hypothetical protein
MGKAQVKIYLASSVKHDPLQRLAGLIDRQEEVLEQRHVKLLQLGKVHIVDVGGEEGVRHSMADGLHQLHEFIYGLEEVEGNEPDARILPKRPCWDSPSRDDNLGPGRTL